MPFGPIVGPGGIAVENGGTIVISNAGTLNIDPASLQVASSGNTAILGAYNQGVTVHGGGTLSAGGITEFDYTGSGCTVSASGHTATVNIAGGGGSVTAYSTYENASLFFDSAPWFVVGGVTLDLGPFSSPTNMLLSAAFNFTTGLSNGFLAFGVTMDPVITSGTVTGGTPIYPTTGSSVISSLINDGGTSLGYASFADLPITVPGDGASHKYVFTAADVNTNGIRTVHDRWLTAVSV